MGRLSFIGKYCDRLSWWACVLVSLFSFASISWAAYDFSYSGRLVDTTGRPLAGPVALKVGFFHSPNATTSVLDVTTGLDNVLLKDGVFQIVLTLDDSEFHRVFPGVSQAVYIEVTDLTNSPSSPYARQQLTILPYAGKIPVDSSQFRWSSEGKLQMLSTGADASATATLTNKTIDASANTITGISNTNISATAAIDDSKLATVSTAGKVSGSAITSGTIAGSTAVSTSGSIATTGKVGVGAAAGTSQLEVKGAGATSATSSLNIMDSGGGSKLYVRDDGNVGIGTTSPTKTLSVSVDTSDSSIRVPLMLRNVNNHNQVRMQLSILADASTTGTSGMQLFHSNDSTSGAGWANYEARPLSFWTGTSAGTASQRLTIDTTGNVGIGTTNPSDILEIARSGAFSSTISNTAYSSSDADNRASVVVRRARGTQASPSAVVANDSLGDLNFGGFDGSSFQYPGNVKGFVDGAVSAGNVPLRISFVTGSNGSNRTERMTVKSDGKVGIGIGAPANNFSVSPVQYSTGTASQSATTVTGSGTTWTSAMVGSQFVFANGTSAGTITAFGSATLLTVSVSQTVTSQNYSIHYPGLNVTSTGNVGIGTTSPNQRLDVAGGITSLGGFNGGAGGQYSGVVVGDRNNAAVSTSLYTSSGKFRIFNNGSDRLTVDASGNVGIGTTSPAQALDVQSSSGSTQVNVTGYGTGVFNGTTSRTARGTQAAPTAVLSGDNLGFWGAGAYNGSAFTGTRAGFKGWSAENWSSSANGSYLTMETTATSSNTPSERVRIDSNGNVGIGTTSPLERLHVNGRIRVDTLAAAAATAVCIDGSNTLASCSSSRRYKEDIKPLGLGLDAVMTMRPVTFKWLNRNEQDLGFIAEEMNEISPLLNNYRDGKIEGVKYGQVTAVLVNAFQELKSFVDKIFGQVTGRIERLEAENETIRAESERLKADNDAMKEVLCELKPNAAFCVGH